MEKKVYISLLTQYDFNINFNLKVLTDVTPLVLVKWKHHLLDISSHSLQKEVFSIADNIL